MKTILYVMDSLRNDYVGYNNNQVYTPNIDSIAKGGIVFDNAFSQGIYTGPSSVSLFSGLYPDAHNVLNFDDFYSESIPIISEKFNRSETLTACFSTTAAISKERGYDRGFDYFDLIDDGEAALKPNVMKRLNEELIPWIKENRDEDFLIIAWGMGTHHPYETPSQEDEEFSEISYNEKYLDGSLDSMIKADEQMAPIVKDKYRNVIEYSDSKFGEIVSTLKDINIFDETELILTSDHGEIFNEHHRLKYTNKKIKGIINSLVSDKVLNKYSLTTDSAFLGHQAIIPFDELIRVPLVIKPSNESDYPVQAGTSIDRQVELTDIFPTILDSHEVEKPSYLQGQSLHKQHKNLGKEYVYSTSKIVDSELVFRSIRDESHKLCIKKLSMNMNNITKRDLQSIGFYFLGKNSILLKLNSQDIHFDQEKKEKLKAVLQSHLKECRSLYKEINSGYEGEHEVNKSVTNQLKNLGYK